MQWSELFLPTVQMHLFTVKPWPFLFIYFLLAFLGIYLYFKLVIRSYLVKFNVIYQSSIKYMNNIVLQLREGSIIAEMEIRIVNENDDEILQHMKTAVDNGGVAVMHNGIPLTVSLNWNIMDVKYKGIPLTVLKILSNVSLISILIIFNYLSHLRPGSQELYSRLLF